MEKVILFALFCIVVVVLVNVATGFSAPAQDASQAAAAAGSIKTFLSAFGF